MNFESFFDPEARLLERLRTRMNRIFTDAFDEGRRLTENGFHGWAYPPLNLWEDAESLYAECELPGTRMDDIEVFVVGRELGIKGERKPLEAKEATFHRREREAGAFSRIVRLPVDVDAEKVHAELHNGVLTVTLPKAAEARPKKVTVKSVSK